MPRTAGPSVPVDAGRVPPVGTRFLPLPGALAVWSATATADGFVLVAAAGTPVHAVVTGEILRPPAGASTGGDDGLDWLILHTGAGVQYRYDGLAPDLPVVDGDRVEAGAILGALGDPVGAGPARLVLRAVDADGEPLDVAAGLVGAIDPNELGYGPVGLGIGVDPDDLDRELATEPPARERPR